MSQTCSMKHTTESSPPLTARFAGVFYSLNIVMILLAVFHFQGLLVDGNAFELGKDHWTGTWATAPQHFLPSRLQTLHDQTVRLIVHISVGGKKLRVRISNTYGTNQLLIGDAHVARRTTGAEIDETSDRSLTFNGRRALAIPAGSTAVSDAVDMDMPALSDLAVSIYFPGSTEVTTWHSLALQTNYVSAENVKATSRAKFPTDKTITTCPFLTGMDVDAPYGAYSIVAFGASLTDGDGSTKDTNGRWPDVLAERLQKDADRNKELGILNEGIIGNRLLHDYHSLRQSGGPPPLGPVYEQLGPVLGESGVTRFERDVLAQPGVKYVILGLGVK